MIGMLIVLGLLATLVVLDVAAWRWGFDSRDIGTLHSGSVWAFKRLRGHSDE